LEGLVCFVWVAGILLFSVSMCVMICHHKSIVSAIGSKISRAYKSIAFVERLERGNQDDLLNVQFLYSAASSLAILVAVATYLWSKDVEATCLAPEFVTGPAGLVSVHNRFNTVLKMWFTFAVVDFFRSLLALFAISLRSKPLAWLYQVFIVNDLYCIACVIILHVFRFEYSGKWCSGDFLTEGATDARKDYLIERGKILLGLVMYVWVGLLTYGCILSCLITATSRRERLGGKKVEKVDDSVEKQAFVSHGPAPYEREIRTVIAACQAASCGHVRILDLLAKRGIVSLDEGDYDNRTPLHVAVAAGQIEAVKYLLNQGANINPQDRWNSTPLNDANNKEIAALLQSKGAKLGKKHAYTPIKIQNLNDDDNRLFYAAFRNDVKNMTILKNQGWRVNAFDYDGRTALGIAASQGNLEAV